MGAIISFVVKTHTENVFHYKAVSKYVFKLANFQHLCRFVILSLQAWISDEKQRK
jgi:hypothetical protein